MAEVGLETRELLHRAQAAVRVARDRRRLAEAWELLQERTPDGAVLGPLAYTDEALVVLRQLLADEPDNHDALAHLALARHARAWDSELEGRPEAKAEWREALELWRRLGRAGGFWEELETALADPDLAAAEAPHALRDARAALMEHLLGIHVGFVRQYVETQQTDRAVAHLELVRQAAIAPAAKKRLIVRVYEAMVGVALSEGSLRGAAALAAIQRFCDLFPDHFPALEALLRAGLELLSGWSYQDDAQWRSIRQLDTQLRAGAARLVKHPALPDAPLAQATLCELAYHFLQRGLDRSRGALLRCREQLLEQTLLEAEQATELGEAWLALARDWAPKDSDLESTGGMIHDRRYSCLGCRIQQVCESEVTAGSARALRRLLQQQEAELVGFLACYPDDPETPAQLAELRGVLAELDRPAALFADDAEENNP